MWVAATASSPHMNSSFLSKYSAQHLFLSFIIFDIYSFIAILMLWYCSFFVLIETNLNGVYGNITIKKLRWWWNCVRWSLLLLGKNNDKLKSDGIKLSLWKNNAHFLKASFNLVTQTNFWNKVWILVFISQLYTTCMDSGYSLIVTSMINPTLHTVR